MYISLLCAHVGLYCMENLHYCIRECYHCSITGCPPIQSLVAIKGGREAFARSTSILKLWLAFGVLALAPPEVCVVLSNKRC